ncbi:right-handed parallel beta-helix repeat-containing protein [Saccharothrix syringae]|uniref:right-handed parallel beta-helix repeat-containing protein n=1 Tax=Saccharothrix syringae TaxID=103733 RepID=UPI000B13C83C|nr:right-handed parallel beta-helix repeat-containing protein [Saccharothrix syringae]
MTAVVVALLLSGVTPKGQAATRVYYVDRVAGSDSAAGTSPQTAWRTVGRVSAAALAPGDSVLLRRGQTWSGRLTVRSSGTATAPISIGAYGTGERPVLGGDPDRCVELAGSHVRLSDVQVGTKTTTGRCGWAGVLIAGDHDRVEGVLVTGAAAGVYVAPESEGAVITDNDLVDNNRMSVNTPGGYDDSGAFAILVQGDRADIGWNRISGSIAASYDYGEDGAAVEVYYGSGNHVHHNVSVDNETFTELGTAPDDPDGVSADNVFEYNAILGSRTHAALVTRGGETDEGPVLRTVFRNNSVSLPNAAAEGVVCYGGCTDEHLELAQNVISAAAKAAYADPGFTATHHNVFHGLLQLDPGTTDVVVDDPGFTGPSNLRPRPDSPAVDLGTTAYADVDLDGNPVGLDGRVEAGAYELPVARR